MINRHTSIKLKVYTLPINHLNTIGFTFGRWEHSHRTNLAVKLTKKDEEKKNLLKLLIYLYVSKYSNI